MHGRGGHDRTEQLLLALLVVPRRLDRACTIQTQLSTVRPRRISQPKTNVRPNYYRRILVVLEVLA